MNAVDPNPVVSADLSTIASCGLDWTDLLGSTILITGGSGLLGSYLVKTFLNLNKVFGLNIHVICLTRSQHSIDKRLSSVLDNSKLEVILHDVSAPLPVDLPSADYVIHVASQASPNYYGVDPVGTLSANTIGTANLLDYCYKRKCKRFLFFSSGEVYGVTQNQSEPITETDYGYIDPMKVRSCYAESKRMGENMCVAWSHQFGCHASIVRPFHTYGPGLSLDDGRVFADFVSDIVNKRDIVLKSDGLAKRSFCYLTDATIGFLTVLLHGSSGEAYNVGNPSSEVSMRDLAHILADLYPSLSIGVEYQSQLFEGHYLKSPISRALPSISKMSALGWKPFVGIEEGFDRTIRSFLMDGLDNCLPRNCG